jgi:hypothetical protein
MAQKKKAKPKKTPPVMGRPTNYSNDIVKKSIEYLKMFADGKPPKFETVPTIVGLCRHINRSKSTVYKWRNEEGKQNFSDTLEAIEEFQETMLASGGLSGAYNAAITKLMLANHGYTDKQDVDVTSGGEKLQSIAPHEFIDGSKNASS